MNRVFATVIVAPAKARAQGTIVAASPLWSPAFAGMKRWRGTSLRFYAFILG